jgi:D-alanine-D-alanine ligase
MKICVLQPDYSTSSVDYQYYDPARNLSALLPDDQVDHVFLNKLTTYKQLKALSKAGYDIFVNLCEGYLEWEVPSIDVIQFLDMLNLPYTGPTTTLYDPPKELMKYVAHTQKVKTPAYFPVDSLEDLDKIEHLLQFPLFVKPAKAGDSLGIDEDSLVTTPEALRRKVAAILPEYPELLVENYIEGREFTVLVAADAADPKKCRTFTPVEFIFPKGNRFKTYALKTSELHPEANIPCPDPDIERRLRAAAARIFRGFGGVGYARMDFRMDAGGQLYFLEVNFTCSVFYSAGYEGSADYILLHDGAGQAGFLRHIIAEGIARHRRKQPNYSMRGNAIVGYGIYANRDFMAGDVVFKGEERSQRIATRRYVRQNWSDDEKEAFRNYAYPLSDEVFILWDENPAAWSPQNHSCDPNTTYEGLNLIALRPIRQGDEITLDYTTYLNEAMEPFECHCGAPNCRGWITGIPRNTVTLREMMAQSA